MNQQAGCHVKEVVIIDGEDEASTDPCRGKNHTQRSSLAPQKPCQPSGGPEHVQGLSSLSPGQSPHHSAQASNTIDAKPLPQTTEAAYYTATSWHFPEYNVFRSPTKTFSRQTPRSTTGSSKAETLSLGSHQLESCSISEASQVGVVDSTPSRITMSSTLSQPATVEIVEEDNADDFLSEEEFVAWISEQHEQELRRLSAASEPRLLPRRKSAVIATRNPPIRHPSQSLANYTYNGVRITSHCCVELRDEDFMKIVHIVKDTSNSEITVRGHIFRRTREMNGLLDRKLNEVCWILHVDDDDPRQPLEQGMESRPVSSIVRRRALRLTNKPYPYLSFRHDVKDTQGNVFSHGVLVCRYKYLCIYSNGKARMAYSWREKGFHRLRKDECDKRADNDARDCKLRQDWRGTTTVGGAQQGWLPGEKDFLRQEAISHDGRTSYQSLKAPSGLDFPRADIMERGPVGSILDVEDLSQGIDMIIPSESRQVTSSTIAVQSTERATHRNVDKSITPVINQSQQRHRSQSLSAQLSQLDALVSSSIDRNIDEATHMFDLSRSPKRRRIENVTIRETSPEVIEIDAKIKTSTSSGTLKKHYEGKITSTYIPRPSSGLKRPAVQFSELSMTPSLKAQMNSGIQSERHHCRNSVHEVVDLTNPMITHGHRPRPKAGIGFSLPITGVSRAHVHTAGMGIQASTPSMNSLHHASASEAHASGLVGPSASSQNMKHSTSPKTNEELLESSTRRCTVSEAREKPGKQTTPGLTSKHRIKTEKSSRYTQRRYTFGDCFCGAGGMSRAAVEAGLRVRWGFDFNRLACESYELNFFGTPVYNVRADQFANATGNHTVDILHLSPPCQYFSDAHTIQGKDDEMNTASLFAISTLLEKAKPRVATLEQTSGLIRRHPIYFNSVINMFTSKGFSVRWRVMNCADFGLPQRRMRLFIIASCPGEPLPPFPTPTHTSTYTPTTPLSPYNTIATAISNIPPDWPGHDLERCAQRSLSPNSGFQLAKCITTSGGPNNVHPSGTRDYTNREFACLQGFPLGHKFGAKGMKKQVGNAVPPVVGRVFLEGLRRFLEGVDGEEGEV